MKEDKEKSVKFWLIEKVPLTESETGVKVTFRASDTEIRDDGKIAIPFGPEEFANFVKQLSEAYEERKREVFKK